VGLTEESTCTIVRNVRLTDEEAKRWNQSSGLLTNPVPDPKEHLIFAVVFLDVIEYEKVST
jgi:hypothetical protein